MPSRLWFILKLFARVLLHLLDQYDPHPQEVAEWMAHLSAVGETSPLEKPKEQSDDDET